MNNKNAVCYLLCVYFWMLCPCSLSLFFLFLFLLCRECALLIGLRNISKVYRGVEIGANKEVYSNPQITQNIPYHLIDVVPTTSTFSVAEFYAHVL
jgi:hypothetical protein